MPSCLGSGRLQSIPAFTYQGVLGWTHKPDPRVVGFEGHGT